MEGIKHYPIASFVLFICELISLIILTMCFRYRQEYDTSGDREQEMYCLAYYVSYADGGFSEENAEYLIDCLRDITNQYDLYKVQVRNYDDILISQETIMSGEEIEKSLLNFLSDRNQSDKNVMYEIFDEKEMTKEYSELYNMALKKGIYIDIYQHEEVNDAETEKVGKRIYRLLMFGTVILVNLINIISIITWFMRRKKEYIIKYLFGESLWKLQINFCIDFLLLLLVAFLLLLFIVSVKSTDSILNVLKYGSIYTVFAFVQFVVLIKMIGNTKN